MIGYCGVEGTALLISNRDILDALVEALIESGELSGERVDEIISECIAASAVDAETPAHDWQARIANAQTFQQDLVQ